MKTRLLVLILFSVLSGCATTHSTSLTYDEIQGPFESGRVRLTCDTACSGAWGWNRSSLKAFYDQGLFEDLATSVVRVGMRVDLAYFYLGYAAEGMGFPRSARTYYKLAFTVYECDGFINNCDGLDVKKEAEQGLARLVSMIDAADKATGSPEVSSTRAASDAAATGETHTGDQQLNSTDSLDGSDSSSEPGLVLKRECNTDADGFEFCENVWVPSAKP